MTNMPVITFRKAVKDRSLFHRKHSRCLKHTHSHSHTIQWNSITVLVYRGQTSVSSESFQRIQNINLVVAAAIFGGCQFFLYWKSACFVLLFGTVLRLGQALLRDTLGKKLKTSGKEAITGCFVHWREALWISSVPLSGRTAACHLPFHQSLCVSDERSLWALRSCCGQFSSASSSEEVWLPHSSQSYARTHSSPARTGWVRRSLSPPCRLLETRSRENLILNTQRQKPIKPPVPITDRIRDDVDASGLCKRSLIPVLLFWAPGFQWIL